MTGLKPEHIGYENGVLGGVISTLTAFAAPGDPVLLHKPTYIGFTKSIENNGYKIIHSDLVKDEQGIWRMDYEDMDRKLKSLQHSCGSILQSTQSLWSCLGALGD